MMKHILSLTLLLCTLLVTAPVSVLAADGDAGQAGAFLTYGAGSRAIGMGRAFVGLADDVTAAYWNPGGLSGVKQNQVMLQYMALVDQNNYQYLGYTHILPYIGTIGVGLVFLNQGEAEGRDTFNEVTESFSNNQFAFTAGFGADITPQLSGGGTLKIVNQTMMGLSATGFGLDAGFMYRPFAFLNLGLSFQNLLAPSITLRDDADVYPMNMTLGIGTKIWNERLKADVDISKNMDQDKVKIRFGMEGIPYHNVFVRSGFDDTEVNVGAGYRFADFQLDYAIGFPLVENVEMMHKIDLSYYFGGYVLEVNPEPNRFSPVGINKVSVLKISCQTKFQIRLWSVEIFNEANTPVKKYSGEGSPPKHIVWDGLEDSMNPMPDGKYRVVLTIEDASGDVRRAPNVFVTIQSVLPLGVSPVELDAF